MQSKECVVISSSYVRSEGGYGWYVVLSIFICFVCITGIQKANGLIFVYFVEWFEASNSAISTITFVQKISEILTALIWSICAERYGSRIMVFCGAGLVTIGFVLSAFASSILFMTLTYGVICGAAFPMVVFPALQMLPRYFEKRLAIASALTFCGQSVGSLAVPYIVSESVAAYGLHGSFIIIAAIHLHIFIAAMLLRPFVQSKHSAMAVPKQCDRLNSKEKSNENGNSDIPPVICRSVSLYEPNIYEEADLPMRHLHSTAVDVTHMSGSEEQEECEEMTVGCDSSALSVACMSVGAPVPLQPITSLNAAQYDAEVASVCRDSQLGVFSIVLKKYSATARNKFFLLLAFSMFLHSFTMSLFVTFQQAYVVDIGYGDDFRQILLISLSSVAEFFSRIAFGFAISRSWLKSHQWNQLSCCLLAAAIASYPFVTSYVVIVIYNCFVSVIFSIILVSQMPNMNEFLGIDAAAIAQGLMVIPGGLGMVSVQIGGVLRDTTGSFRIAFFMAASTLLISALNYQLISHLASKQMASAAENGIGSENVIQDITSGEQSRNSIDSGCQDVTASGSTLEEGAVQNDRTSTENSSRNV